MLFTDLHDPIHVCRKSIQMHRHNCLHIGIFLKGTLQCFRRHIPGLIITIDKDRNRFLIGNGIGRCREGQILAEHNIASLHSSCFQCQMKSCRACGQCRCILRSHICCQFFLKFIDILAKWCDPVGIKCLFHILLLISFFAHMRRSKINMCHSYASFPFSFI